MNAQEAKYQMVKKALLAVSFDWTTITYTKQGEVAYVNPHVFFQPNADTLWSLEIVNNTFFYLVHGDKRFNLGFICEFNTTEEHVVEMAEKINTAAQKLCK